MKSRNPREKLMTDGGNVQWDRRMDGGMNRARRASGNRQERGVGIEGGS